MNTGFGGLIKKCARRRGRAARASRSSARDGCSCIKSGARCAVRVRGPCVERDAVGSRRGVVVGVGSPGNAATRDGRAAATDGGAARRW